MEITFRCAWPKPVREASAQGGEEQGHDHQQQYGDEQVLLAEWREQHDHPLGPFGHLGVGCESRAEVDRLCAEARAEGRLRSGPTDTGYPVGYWAYIADPDGNNLEVSYGQDVGLTVERSQPKPR